MNTQLLTQIVDELSGVMDRPAAEKLAQVVVSVYERLHESLVIRRLDSLETAVRQLAVSQQQMYTEFQEYRKQTDERFRELREAQQQMYAEFQEYRRQTDERFRELAETVRLTQEALRDLALTVKDLQKQVGGLSQTVGYVLENEAMKSLPELLLRNYGLRVEGRLKRRHVQDSTGRYIEVNIFGTATRNGEQVTLIGESKSQLSKNDIDRFLRRTVDALRAVYPNIFPILVTHITSEPDAEDYARSLGVAVFYSYEF